jgi:hypothetical protein
MKVVADRKQSNRETTPAHVQAQTPDASSSFPLRRPEESVYFNPQFNPMGTPPPGYPPMYRAPPALQGPNLNSTHPPVLPQPTWTRPNYGYLNTPLAPSLPQVQFNQYIAPRISNSRPDKPSLAPVDPLDPSASGYNKRFGSELQKRKRLVSEIIDEPCTPNSLDSFEDGPPVDHRLPISTTIEIPSLTVADPLPEDIPPQAPVEVEKMANTTSINIAELMKRRKMIVSDSSEIVGPTRPNTEGPVGPSPTSTQLPQQGLLGICYSSESDSEDVPIDPVEVPSQSSAAQDYPHFQTFPIPAATFVDATPPPIFISPTSGDNSTPHPATMIPPPSKPKQIQVESELVSFVPAALRVRRAAQQTKPKPQPQPAQQPLAPNPPSNSVDSAYDEFMLEISQLGS